MKQYRTQRNIKNATFQLPWSYLHIYFYLFLFCILLIAVLCVCNIVTSNLYVKIHSEKKKNSKRNLQPATSSLPFYVISISFIPKISFNQCFIHFLGTRAPVNLSFKRFKRLVMKCVINTSFA